MPIIIAAIVASGIFCGYFIGQKTDREEIRTAYTVPPNVLDSQAMCAAQTVTEVPNHGK